MIEISDIKYWRKLKYYDGLLYLSLLEIDGVNDWRMIKNIEELDWKSFQKLSGGCWYQDDEFSDVNIEYWVIPVRDI